MTDQQHPITPPPELMTDTTRNLIIKLSSHMAYMQGQLEARHELDDLEDYYWYRESVALRQQVADALAADEPAVPEGREPASVVGEPSDQDLYDYWVSTSPEFGCADPVGFARAVLARWSHPAPAPVTDDDLDLLVIAIQALRPKASPGSHDLAAVDRGTEILRKWLAARGMA